MKIRLITAAVLVLAGTLAFAQDPSALKASYERQVRMVGPAGVGVETILDRWEAADPDNPEVLRARFSFHFAKSRSSRVVPMDKPKYLGAAPVITLKDSAGRDMHYYEVDFFDDEQFSLSQKAINRAIALVPADLGLRVDKINSLILYEKESPDLASEEIIRTIDYNVSRHPVWTVEGQEAEAGLFKQLVMDYCVTFFNYGTPGSYEAFRAISEKMLRLDKKDTDFMSNMGSYYLVCKDNPRQAVRWYEKVLKIKPDDYTAAHNCVLVAHRDKNVRMEKKYLPYLIKATTDEMERRGYEIRLEALEKK